MQRDPYPDHVGARDGREAGEQVGCCRPPSLLCSPQSLGGAQECLEEAVPGACPANWLKQPKRT